MVVRKGAKWALAIGCVATLLVVRMWHTGQGGEQWNASPLPASELATPQRSGQPEGPEDGAATSRGVCREPAATKADPVAAPPHVAVDPAAAARHGQGAAKGVAAGGNVRPTVEGRHGSWVAEVESGRLEKAVSQLSPQSDGAAPILDVRSPAFISEVLARHRQEIQDCYRQRVKVNPCLEGRIDVRFEVSPEGAITRVEVVESTLGDPDLESCLVNSMLRWNDFGRCAPQEGPRIYRQQYTFGVENR